MNPSQAPNTNLCILHLETEPEVLEWVGKVLREAYPDIEIAAADNVETALALFAEHHPEIVVAGLGSGKSGIEMAKEIRSLKPETQIILVTSNTEAEFLIEAIRIGVNRYVLKPVDQQLLLEAVDHCIARARIERHVKHEIMQKQRMIDQIGSLNTTLAARVAELEASQKELAKFNYRVSHDLRGPLSNIHGFCQLLLLRMNLDEQSREFVEDIYGQIQRMEQLIKTLMEFFRVKDCALKRQQLDLGAIAQAAADELRLKQTARDVSLVIDQNVTAEADPQLIRVVMENLLGNAWKFTAGTTHAVIEFGEEICGGNRSYFVRDNGAGFDKTHSDKLFTPFERLHPATEFPGSGMGLATVQRIIARHGGRIWAEGEIGKGATFFFTLQ